MSVTVPNLVTLADITDQFLQSQTHIYY